MKRRPRIQPVHPGDILREELAERGISMNQLARDIRVPLSRVSLVVHGKRGITADTAMRLALYFGTSPGVVAQFADHLRTRPGTPGIGGQDQARGHPSEPARDLSTWGADPLASFARMYYYSWC